MPPAAVTFLSMPCFPAEWFVARYLLFSDHPAHSPSVSFLVVFYHVCCVIVCIILVPSMYGTVIQRLYSRVCGLTT